jgi:hypothetical protein
MNIGAGHDSGADSGTTGMDNTIRQAVFLFYCIANKQV